MTAVSRPLRALGVVIGGWTTIRAVMLWPAGSDAALPTANIARIQIVPPAVAAPLDTQAPLFVSRTARFAGAASFTHDNAAGQVPRPSEASETVRVPSALESGPGFVVSGASVRQRAQSAERPQAYTLAIAPEMPVSTGRDRFSGSAWALMRDDGAAALASGGQLGGSQVGLRIYYAPGPDWIAVTTRVSTGLSRPAGREAAVGVAVRGRNFGLIVEQRVSLDKGTRDAPAVIAYGGVSDVRLPGGLTLDGYAQAGVVGVKTRAAFADGAVRVERPILSAAGASVGVGAGVWGGVQPGLARVDIAPQIVAHLPLPRASLRVSAEWRQRIVGDAAPASGPSVTVGLDF